MMARTGRYLSILIGIAMGLVVVSCSSPEPTPVPTPIVRPTAIPIPTSTPTAWEVYTGSLGIEWELLGLADDAVTEAWTAFVGSIGPSGEGYPGTAVAAEAALNTYVQRSTAMQEKMKTITPPPECERFNVLISEVAEVGVESANVMQEIVVDGYFADETTRKLEVAMAQVSSVASDLDNAQRECR